MLPRSTLRPKGRLNDTRSRLSVSGIEKRRRTDNSFASLTIRPRNATFNSVRRYTEPEPIASRDSSDDENDNYYSAIALQPEQNNRHNDANNDTNFNITQDEETRNAIAFNGFQSNFEQPPTLNMTEDNDVNKDQIAIQEVDRSIRKCKRYVLQWERMVGLVSLVGPWYFIYKGLQLVSDCIQTASNGSAKVPTYKTVKSSQWKFLSDSLFIRSSLL